MTHPNDGNPLTQAQSWPQSVTPTAGVCSALTVRLLFAPTIMVVSIATEAFWKGCPQFRLFILTASYVSHLGALVLGFGGPDDIAQKNRVYRDAVKRRTPESQIPTPARTPHDSGRTLD